MSDDEANQFNQAYAELKDQYDRLQAESDALKKERDEARHFLKEALCQACGGSIRSESDFLFKELIAERDALAAQLQQAREERDAGRRMVDSLSLKADRLEAEEKEAQGTVDRLRAELSTALAELAEARKRLELTADLQHVTADTMGKEIKDLEEERDRFEAQLSAANDRVQSLRRALEGAKGQAEQLFPWMQTRAIYANQLDPDMLRADCERFAKELFKVNEAAKSALASAPASTTTCAVCSEVKPTPLRRDDMGGYVCLTCIDKELSLRLPASTSGVRSDSERLRALNAAADQEYQ